jgi:hypothetical protein
MIAAVHPNSKNGPNRRRPFDRWFRYPAGFSTETLERCFQAAGVRRGDLLVDPFAGVATTATSAITHGVRFRGIEVHPLIAEVAALKLMRPITQLNFRDVAEEIASTSQPERLNAEASLVRRCFPDETLRTLVGFRQRIERSRSPWRRHLRMTLLGILRDFATVKVGWPHQRPAVPRKPIRSDVHRAFTERAREIADDLAQLSGLEDASVHCADARRLPNWRHVLRKEQANACISSPPYLNNFDYADATRLELYFFGYIQSWADMVRSVRFDMVRSATQQVTIPSADSSWAYLSNFPAIHRELKAVNSNLELERHRRAGAKHYDRLLPCYFADMLHVLSAAARSMTARGRLVWVVGDSAPYGIHVDTPKILARLGNAVGFKTSSIESIRIRGDRWSTNGSRHHVPLAESILVLTKP